MPSEFSPQCVRLIGQCRVEEAEDLRDWLQRYPECAVDLAQCAQLHTALLQVLLCAQRTLIALPQDAILAAWLARYVALPSESAISG